ncbi:DnaB-like helicase C-terminal domain-containing protein [Mycoplasma sp. 46852]|uniref:DnaB-like helicase C-terminal domain-containing protein n=1 Tax=Mycoplasma sp. 46852 TaxID=3401683 RepID=UPI003AACBE40
MIKFKNFISEWKQWVEAPNLNIKTIKNTGFDIIDNQLQGLRPNQLIILGGRPGAGKTTFALNVMNNINGELAENERILFISLEQSTSELLQKSISMKTYFPLKNFYNSENIIQDLAKDNKEEIKELLSTSKLIVIDDTEIKAENIAKIIYELQEQQNIVIRAVFVDHVQILGTNKFYSSKTEQVSLISRELKKLALSLQIPVFALSQMSRDWAKEKNKTIPNLTDLRDSGALEQDADIVMFIYKNEKETSNLHLQDRLYLTISKNRNGQLADPQPLIFFSSIAKMIEEANSQEVQNTYIKTRAKLFNI